MKKTHMEYGSFEFGVPEEIITSAVDTKADEHSDSQNDRYGRGMDRFMSCLRD